MKKGEFAMRCVALVLVLGVTPTVAVAYIDPGNGAYMVQMLFTLVGAALFYLRHPVRFFKLAWNRFFGKDQAAQETSADSDRGSDVSSTDPHVGPLVRRDADT